MITSTIYIGKPNKNPRYAFALDTNELVIKEDDTHYNIYLNIGISVNIIINKKTKAAKKLAQDLKTKGLGTISQNLFDLIKNRFDLRDFRNIYKNGMEHGAANLRKELVNLLGFKLANS